MPCRARPESRPRRRPRVHRPGPHRVCSADCCSSSPWAAPSRSGCGPAQGPPPAPRRVAAPARRAPVTARSTTTVPAVRPFTATVGDTTGCQTLAAVAPQLLCPIPDGTVTYMQVTDLASRIARPREPTTRVAERGDAACARGHDDERAWSRPTRRRRSPAATAAGSPRRRAEMWWTVDDAGVLAHATRADGDLAALFSWWRAHAEHP